MQEDPAGLLGAAAILDDADAPVRAIAVWCPLRRTRLAGHHSEERRRALEDDVLVAAITFRSLLENLLGEPTVSTPSPRSV